MKIIWSARGYNWGFKFLETGGYDDPLPIYESAFGTDTENYPFFKESRKLVALRFIDLEQREDQFARPIIHEFVILEPDIQQDSEAWIHQLWQQYAPVYRRLYRQINK